MGKGTVTYGRLHAKYCVIDALSQQFEELQQLRDRVRRAEAKAMRMAVSGSQRKSRLELTLYSRQVPRLGLSAQICLEVGPSLALVQPHYNLFPLFRIGSWVIVDYPAPQEL
jgi:hypothetical protein